MRNILQKFNETYDITSPKMKIGMKLKNLKSPWITKGVKKFSKKKSSEHEEGHKSDKNIFEVLKKDSKQDSYQEKLKNMG